jgi:hypothetical protein
MIAATVLLGAGGLLGFGLVWVLCVRALCERQTIITHADANDDDDDDDDNDDDDDDGGGGGDGDVGDDPAISSFRRNITTAAKAAAVRSATTTLAKLKKESTGAPERTSVSKGSRPGKQGKSIKAFVEVDGNVHIVHVAMAAIESVAELRGALTAACIELSIETGAVSGASELADLNFELDAALQIHYLDDQNVARLVQDDTPIGLLKCAKALRAWRKP